MLGPLISAGASILGGLLGKSSADSAREAAQQQAANNERLQREFAQNGIQWKVEDAKKAGIHPIYALGGSTASFTPSSVNFAADTSMPNALAQAGQDIGRAVHSTRTEKDRMGAMAGTIGKLQVEGLSLDNDAKRLEIASKAARLRSDQVGPPMPASTDAYLLPGQTQSGLVKQKAMETTPAPTNAPWAEPGSVGDVGYANVSKGGGFAPVPSKDVKERIEDNMIQEFMWAVRNNVLPSLGFRKAPPPIPAGKDREWIYDFMHQAYRSSPNVESKYGYGKRPAGWYIR